MSGPLIATLIQCTTGDIIRTTIGNIITTIIRTGTGTGATTGIGIKTMMIKRKRFAAGERRVTQRANGEILPGRSAVGSASV